MPTIELTEMELRECARGQRCLADIARSDAERQGQSSTRTMFEGAVKRHLALAERFEQAANSALSAQIRSKPRRLK